MISIFNESKYAEQIIQNGFISNKKGFELFVLAKYYRFEYGKTNKECKYALTEFCENNIDRYLDSDFYRKVNSALNQAYKNNAKLLKIDEIEFSESEIDYIKELDISNNAKRVLFCLWCCNKINIKAGQSDKWVSISPTDLKKMSNESSNNSILHITNELYNNSLIFISDKWAISLSFLDDINLDNEYSSNSIIVHTDDFWQYGLLWEQYNGNKKISRCKNCKKLFSKNSNRQIYCRECARQNELDKYIKYNKKRKM